MEQFLSAWQLRYRCYEPDELVWVLTMMQISLYAAHPLGEEKLHDTARRLLRCAVKEAGFPAALRLETLPGGKPCCTDYPGFHFNLSHTEGWAVCAAAACPVGVDIQRERPLHSPVIRRFSSWEQEQLAALPRASFFDFWVLKEAAAKCTGRCGMHGVLYGSEVTLSPLSVGMPGIQAALVPFPAAGLHLAVAAATEEVFDVQLHLK